MEEGMNALPTLSDPPARNSSALHFSEHVRTLAVELRDKTRSTPFAPETVVLANEVATLCDFVNRLHRELDKVLTESQDQGEPAGRVPARSAVEDEDAVVIQRGNHHVSQTALDVIKALFLWREPPGGLKKVHEERRLKEEPSRPAPSNGSASS